MLFVHLSDTANFDVLSQTAGKMSQILLYNYNISIRANHISMLIIPPHAFREKNSKSYWRTRLLLFISKNFTNISLKVITEPSHSALCILPEANLPELNISCVHRSFTSSCHHLLFIQVNSESGQPVYLEHFVSWQVAIIERFCVKILVQSYRPFGVCFDKSNQDQIGR